MTDDIHIALLMMVKNEHKRLEHTLNTVIGYVNSIVIYDTGSTDDTIEILTNFCDKNNIPLRLKEGEFVDFATSRNVSLDFADTFDDIDYLLLFDTNDELRGGDFLRKLCVEYKEKKNSGFLVCQEWWSGKYDKYYNLRMVKARSGWRYRGKVHEWMKNTTYTDDNEDIVVKVPDDLIIFQDRTQDDDKSGKRFERDKILLLEDHKEDPTEPRTVFYLAQTCSCLKHIEDAFYYYKLRSTLIGFWEEKYHSYYRCGELSQLLGHDWHDTMGWFIKAFEHTERVEPLIKITEYYKDKNWILCYTFASMSCKLQYPTHCILFVDKYAYDYTRWHLLAIAAWYVGFYEEGKIACKKAIQAGLHTETDKNNLKFYEEKEREKDSGKEKLYIMNKKDFINNMIIQLEKENPKLTSKQLASEALNLWKNRKKF